MAKIKVAILGYGNLGKALEKQLLCTENIKLVGIFSRRKNLVSELKTKIFHSSEILKFKNKIDILCLCTGSATSIKNDAIFLAKHFNTISTFDTHSLIPKMFKTLDKKVAFSTLKNECLPS